MMNKLSFHHKVLISLCLAFGVGLWANFSLDESTQPPVCKEEIYRELGNKDGIKLARGSKDFLKLTPSSIFRCSVGTSTERKNVELAISQHNLSKYFLGAACSEDVSRGKPDPEVFLEAAKILSITPKNCVVFEDSPHGIEAAKRAGMKTVALTTTHPSTTFMHLNPDLLVASLADLSVDQVEKLFS